MKARPPAQPYKYFAHFEQADRDIFFGRRHEIEVLLADIVTTRLVVLFARSGTGKSSLINAGVRPRLRDRNYKTVMARVGTDPVAAVQKAAREDELEVPAFTRSFAELLTGIVGAAKRPLVLFLDQFEEFFLSDISDETRRAFIADVGQLYRTKDAGVHLVFSMREDYLAELDAFRDEIPAIFEKESQLRLRLLTPEQAKEAIEGPAGVVIPAFDFEPGLVDRIVADLPREHGLIQPVAVQIVCDTLWRKRSGASITNDVYAGLGKAGGIIEARVARDIADHLNADQILMLESAIELMHTKDWTKRAVSESELRARLGVDPSAFRSFISALEASGLARVDSRASGGTDVRLEWVSDYISELSRDMSPNLRRIWLRKVREAATPLVVGHERTTALLDDTAFLRTLDREEWYFLLRAAASTRDALGQWRRVAQVSGIDPWILIDQALNDPTLSDEDTGRLIQYLGETAGGAAVEILVRQLSRPPRIRTALRSLGAIRDPKAISAIQPFLEEAEWQTAALDALRTIATPEAIRIADSVQKRGSRLLDRLSRTAELHGMEAESWEELTSELLGTNVSGLIGPALSAKAVLKRLTRRFEYPFVEPDDPRVVMEYLNVTFGSGWQKSLVEETNDEPPRAYRSLATLPLRFWLTTDYHTDLERAMTEQNKAVTSMTPYADDATMLRDGATFVIHLLGLASEPESIPESSRAAALLDLEHMNRSYPFGLIITVGFGPEDAEVTTIRRALAKALSPNFYGESSRSMLMIATPPQLENRRQLGRAREYFGQYTRKRKTHFYWGTPEEFVDEFHARFVRA